MEDIFDIASKLGKISLNQDVYKYKCPYNCEQKFKSTVELSHHANVCTKKPTHSRCFWYTSKGMRCRNKGKYGGYCHIHRIDYRYDPGGINDEDGNTEPCSCTYEEPYVPQNIQILKNMFVYNLTFKYKSKYYVIDQVFDTYAIFKTVGVVEEKITVWDSLEEKKGKKGVVVDKFVGNMEVECENRACVFLADEDRHMCCNCFEREYNTTIKSLR